MDGMRAEEHQRVSKGILKAFGNSTEKLDEELKNKVKDYEKKKSVPSFVDRIFGGELTSTIMCDECRTSGKKNINDKNLKKTMEDEDKDSEEEKDNDSYVKERNDIPSGTSKHLQKKAKKQAKKQAKNQRRQQKIQGKVLHLNICTIDHPEDDECDIEMSPQGEVDTKSDHISQEGGTNTEYCVNQRDLNGQEKMTESVTDNQKSTEEIDLRHVIVDNDGEVLSSSPSECARNLNGAFQSEGSNGEVDISSSLKNLHLDDALQPDEINIEILNDSHTGTQVYEVVNEDPETAFCTLANREAFSTDECSIQHCLYQFTRNEKLRDANKLLCEVCTRRQCNGPKANLKGTEILSQKAQLMFRGTLDGILKPPLLCKCCNGRMGKQNLIEGARTLSHPNSS